jgi:hypothetical protein
MKPTFIRQVFFQELFLLLVLSFFCSLICELIDKVEPINQEATIKEIKFQSKNVKILIKEDQKLFLIIHSGWYNYLNRKKLYQLEVNDKITFTKNKHYCGVNIINYFSGQVDVIGLKSERLGLIFNFEVYLENRLNIFLIIFLLLISVPCIIGVIAILIGWILAGILYLFPKKYYNLENHVFVFNKIERKTP